MASNDEVPPFPPSYFFASFITQPPPPSPLHFSAKCGYLKTPPWPLPASPAPPRPPRHRPGRAPLPSRATTTSGRLAQRSPPHRLVLNFPRPPPPARNRTPFRVIPRHLLARTADSASIGGGTQSPRRRPHRGWWPRCRERRAWVVADAVAVLEPGAVNQDADAGGRRRADRQPNVPPRHGCCIAPLSAIIALDSFCVCQYLHCSVHPLSSERERRRKIKRTDMAWGQTRERVRIGGGG